ncbi:MAG TPA: glycosyltransferase family 39 protein [Patescibacteria group bacterium]|nr:glycosyltransferase family 39 protein [Patescibacteria group bacterium]
MKRTVTAITNSWRSIPMLLQLLLIAGFACAIFITAQGIIYHVFFSYDQARDAFEANSILHDDHLKILGPSTDIPGVFHGVLWYYALAVPYMLYNQPEFAALFFSILLYVSAGVLALLTQRLFSQTKITIVAFLLYILSPLFQMSTHWLSNPILSLLAVPVLLFFLWDFLEKPRALSALLSGVLFGIFIQGEFAFALLLICLPLFLFIFKTHITIKQCAAFLIGLLLLLSSFFIAEIKFHFQGIKGAVSFLYNTDHGHVTLQLLLENFLKRSTDFFTTTTFAFSSTIVLFLLGIFTCALIRKMKGEDKKPLLFVGIWLGSLLLFQFFSSGISTSYFLFYAFFPSGVIATAYLLITFLKNKFIFFLGIIFLFFCQIQLSQTYLTNNFVIFTVQQGATLPEEKAIVNYTYQKAYNKPFSIITMTNPLYINTTWAYLYQHYGMTQYGYLPYFAGRGQTGQLGNLPEKTFATDIRFLIFEPNEGIPYIYPIKIAYDEDKVSDIIEEKHFGDYIVQMRRFHKNKPIPTPPAMLLNSPLLHED